MLNREQLRIHGLRAYELGRLRAALRVALVLVPMLSLCLLENRGRTACACVAAALIGACVWLRWRDRQGFEIATSGLQAGSIPLLAGLVFDRLGIECGFAGASAWCTVAATMVGGAAGALIGARMLDARERLWGFLAAATVAALAAAVGCVRLGLVGVAGVVAGIAFGTVVMAAVARSPTSPSR